MMDSEEPQDLPDGWENFQILMWAFMMDYTDEDMCVLGPAFEKWAEELPQEEMDALFNPEVEGDSIERNLAEEELLYTKEDILRSMWKDNE